MDDVSSDVHCEIKKVKSISPWIVIVYYVTHKVHISILRPLSYRQRRQFVSSVVQIRFFIDTKAKMLNKITISPHNSKNFLYKQNFVMNKFPFEHKSNLRVVQNLSWNWFLVQLHNSFVSIHNFTVTFPLKRPSFLKIDLRSDQLKTVTEIVYRL